MKPVTKRATPSPREYPATYLGENWTQAIWASQRAYYHYTTPTSV
jgi:hypothetical protein